MPCTSWMIMRCSSPQYSKRFPPVARMIHVPTKALVWTGLPLGFKVVFVASPVISSAIQAGRSVVLARWSGWATRSEV
jgi:hypothetical protein